MNKSEAFETFIHYLNQQGVKYGVLGNVANYPGFIPSDIDFAIPDAVFKNISSLVKEFCRLNNFAFIQQLQHESCAASFLLACEQNPGQYFFISLDFCSDYRSYGRFYISGETLLNNIEFASNGNGFWKLNDTYEFLYYLIKKLEKRQVDEGQFNHLFLCWSGSKEKISMIIPHFFNAPALAIINKAFEENDYHFFYSNISLLRTSLHKKIRMRLSDFIVDYKSMLGRIIKPTGLVIGLLGRDGVGKSSLIDQLAQNFSPLYQSTIVYHLYPGFFLDQNNTNHDAAQPHLKKERNGILSDLKLIFFFFEYLFGYWIKVYPKKVKAGFIIFDRYFTDVLIDPVRYRQRKNNFLEQLIHRVIPKPDLWLILDASTECILKRKQELTFESSEQLRTRYLNVQKKLAASHIINTELSIEDSVRDATKIIINHLQTRHT